MFRNVKTCGVKAFRDIASLINPQEEKGNAPFGLSLQGGQTLTDLFE